MKEEEGQGQWYQDVLRDRGQDVGIIQEDGQQILEGSPGPAPGLLRAVDAPII